jgi:hypothetical protein
MSNIAHLIYFDRDEDDEQEVARGGGEDQVHVERAHLEHLHSQAAPTYTRPNQSKEKFYQRRSLAECRIVLVNFSQTKYQLRGKMLPTRFFLSCLELF